MLFHENQTAPYKKMGIAWQEAHSNVFLQCGFGCMPNYDHYYKNCLLLLSVKIEQQKPAC